VSETFSLQFQGVEARLQQADAAAFLGSLPSESVDLIVTSPPYFLGKEYDKSRAAADFAAELGRVIPLARAALKEGGSLCWQVGNHVQNGELLPLDFAVGWAMADSGMKLRNRIIWTFSHGAHASTRFSGRHETILWYTKGQSAFFDLDSVRVPQKYPGKRHYKGPNKGDWSGNPLGKNPGDVWSIGEVWDIPNVKAGHVEKTSHPCQFPTALVRRLVTALCPRGGTVVDPYLGSGSAAVSALLEGRNFVGSDITSRYLEIAAKRLETLVEGNLKVRPDMPVRQPNDCEAVAKTPPHFKARLECVDA